MKNRIVLLITLVFMLKMSAQTPTIINDGGRVITSGIPFLLIAPDARAASMGDMGVATSGDAFSQQWNPSKYVFSNNKSGIGVSYTPYLSKLVDDIFLGNFTYFNRIDERSAFAASLRYFSLGEIEFRDDPFVDAFVQKPNEFTLDASYSLRLTDQFGMSVTGRYLKSDLKLQGVDGDVSPASTFGVDVSGYYQSEEVDYSSFSGRTRLGFAIQNIGPKFKYDEDGVDNFQPTNLRLGAGFDFIFDEFNKVAVTAEVTKLMIPTPPAYGYIDKNGNGTQEEADEPTYIVKGENPDDISFLSGMFKSFNDAPDGFSEELKEFTWSLGAEYLYQESFAFRLGYFNESEEKGARKFLALGAGFKANVVNIDLSYLFSASKIQSPLENTLRFSLTFNIGEGEYGE